MKKLFNLTKYLAVFRYGPQLRPMRDWLVLLALAGILLLASVAWNAWLFEQVSTGQVIGAAPAAAPTFSSASLDTVTTLFSGRAAQQVHYQNDYHFVDPSLPGS